MKTAEPSLTIDSGSSGNQPVLSVVVSHFNPKGNGRIEAMTRHALECLEDHTVSRPLEIIISDGSGCRCAALCDESERRGWVYLASEKPLGFAEGYNAGLKIARGRYCAVMASDIIVVDAWDRRLLGEMERCCAWMGAPYLSMADYPAQSRLSILGQMPTYRPCFMTLNLNVFTRECLSGVGLIDEELSGYFNDLDYLIRVYRHGGTAIIADAGPITHIGRASLSVASSARYGNDHATFHARYPELGRHNFDDMCDYTHPELCRSSIYRGVSRFFGKLLRGKPWQKARNLLMRMEPYLHRV